MATRIFRFTVSLNAGQKNDGVGGDPQPFTITPPSGVVRTIVEIRPWGTQPFEYQGYYDTELYHVIDSNDIQTYHRPHFVGLQVTFTHNYNIQMTNLGSSAGTFGVDVVVEETVASSSAAAAPTAGAG
ncbi:hypothetical protein [Metallosphaera sp.]|uniref:hypothetical protein n=1 Tax=Metallosphaera sp. TaxID=2020860 RepID=UPI00317B64FE